jgi:hypothetical protein
MKTVAAASLGISALAREVGKKRGGVGAVKGTTHYYYYYYYYYYSGNHRRLLIATCPLVRLVDIGCNQGKRWEGCRGKSRKE